MLRLPRDNPNLARFTVEGTLTGRRLGLGSYGSVEEIEVYGRLCAGKRIHDLLLDMDNDGIGNIAEKFLQECELMSNLAHPNITQFLGLYYPPNSWLPILVMERLEGSLDELLEAVPDISLVLKRSMLEGVARGLRYLHLSEIIHRDLTAKNVVLTSSLTAKITDLGNSRIVNFQPGQLARTLSQLPGTLVYMPPEAFASTARYGPSLDIFSFGQLALFTLIQQFPGSLLEPTFRNPDSVDTERLVARSEVERRQNYFEQMERLLPNREHQLFRGMVTDCLRNDPSERPTAERLVSSLERMQESFQGETEVEDEIQHAVTMIRVNRRQGLAQPQTQNVSSSWWKNIVSFVVVVLAAVCLWLLWESDTESKNKFITDLKKGHLARGGRSEQTVLSEPNLPLKLVWREAIEAMPFELSRYPYMYVVEAKGKIYTGGGKATSSLENVVQVYDLEIEKWSTLLPYAYKQFALTLVSNHLVAVGGVDGKSGKRTNLLGFWDEEAQTWTHPYPPMHFPCSSPTVVTLENNFIIVAGGRNDDQKLSRVQILDISYSKWYSGAPHPEQFTQMTSVIVGNMWYLFGGFTKSAKGASKRVFRVCLDDLIYQAMHTSAGGYSPWHTLHDTPFKRSTALALDGALLALGGNDSSVIHMYNKPSSSTWEYASDLPTCTGKSCIYHSLSNTKNSEIFVAYDENRTFFSQFKSEHFY